MKTRLIAGAGILALVIGSSSLALAQGQPKMEGDSKEGRGQAAAPGKATTAPKSDRGAAAPRSQEKSKSANEDRRSGAKRSVEEKGDRDRSKAAEDKGRGEKRTKSAEPRAKGDVQQKTTQEKSKATGSKATDQQERAVSGSTAKGTSGVTTGSVPAPSRVELTGEKRTQVLGAFARHRSEARVTNVNIQVEIGRPIPRTVRLFVVPQEIVEIVPEYRRFRYIILDDVVLIIDPDRFIIIDILPIAA